MTELTLWAPIPNRVRLWLPDSDPRPMTRLNDGWWAITTDQLQDGGDYGFLLDDDATVLPDPRSRRQPAGVHGPSRHYDHPFPWTDHDWSGAGLPGAVIYELHIGTFTPPGTLAAAEQRLPYLAELGVTHVEVLPVNDFNGQWNWGYDGVLWYAAHEAYGGPDGLKSFVNECHRLGLAVVLDVVYNHLGPSGNYLPRFGRYLTSGRNTWGDLINLDGEDAGPVRAYIIENALMWLDEFHVDGLRLDAVHALKDSSPTHILAELSERVDALADTVGRELTLIAESDLNDPVMITPRAQGGYGLDAQWNDDVHHCWHALLTGERQGYYADFGTLPGLAKVYQRAFFHDGTYSSFRKAKHGKPVDPQATPGYRFVVCLQNHDQVGNRAAGDRVSHITSLASVKIGAVLLLTSPFTPMIWMGEEWAAGTRWPFFTSHPEPELAKATAQGRIAEFAEHGWDVSQVIDPQDPLAFERAKLDWGERSRGDHGIVGELYRRLLALRGEHPELADGRLDQIRVDYDEDAQWLAVYRGSLIIAVNLADHSAGLPIAVSGVILATEGGVRVEPSSLVLPPRSAAIATGK